MNWVALRMLTGDRAKYLALVFGVTFATHLMSQQVSIFMGILTRTGNQILDVRDAEVWAMDRRVRYLDEARGLKASDLQRVRGVPGVAWAAPLHKGQLNITLADGQTRNVYLTGLDDASLAGAPSKLVAGRLEDLRQADAVIVDTAGYEYLWGDEPYRLGREFQISGRRAVLVGVCRAGSPFFSVPMLFTRYSQAARYVYPRTDVLTYVLVEPRRGVDPQLLAQRIESQTGLQAATRDQFFWKTVGYFLSSTGIPVNFGVTIALGFVVGAAVTGQTLYLFTLENLKQFGALKAMGLPNAGILAMILLQALLIGALGYGLGIGLTALFFIGTSGITHLAGLHMTWLACVGTGMAVLSIVVATSLVSARKVLVLEPAVVFRG